MASKMQDRISDPANCIRIIPPLVEMSDQVVDEILERGNVGVNDDGEFKTHFRAISLGLNVHCLRV
jgi:hypothetical protein